MKPIIIRKLAQLFFYAMVVLGAAFGALAGVVASGWGGFEVILPTSILVFTLVGAGLGGAGRYMAHFFWPPELDGLNSKKLKRYGR